jgi:hypothetical protein
MKNIPTSRIEFNPRKDILGKTIVRNRTGVHHTPGLQGL